MKRSDLICENGVINDKKDEKFVHKFNLHRTLCEEIIIDKKLSEATGKCEGKYITIYCDTGDYSRCFSEIISDFIGIGSGSVLVAGLGNERVCSDSLGAKSLRFIPATAHLSDNQAFSDLNLRKVFVIETSVTGKTGIESAEQIRCIAEKAVVDFIIVIDSLSCSDTERLCRTIQITDAGISPGAGVGNSRKKLNKSTTGKKVIAIGVPTVIDYEDSNETLMVTPRNIDVLIDEFSRVIGYGISKALNPSLSFEEINALIIR